MITIDYTSLIIGACSVTLIVYLIWILKPKKITITKKGMDFKKELKNIIKYIS